MVPENDSLGEAIAIKRFEYSPLGKDLKAHTDIAKRQYQKLDDTYVFDKIIKKEKPTPKKYSKSDLICNGKYIFYKYYRDIKKSATFL